jgi:hypothetical protein
MQHHAIYLKLGLIYSIYGLLNFVDFDKRINYSGVSLSFLKWKQNEQREDYSI